jgi:hypothetical protein
MHHSYSPLEINNSESGVLALCKTLRTLAPTFVPLFQQQRSSVEGAVPSNIKAQGELSERDTWASLKDTVAKTRRTTDVKRAELARLAGEHNIQVVAYSDRCAEIYEIVYETGLQQTHD